MYSSFDVMFVPSVERSDYEPPPMHGFPPAGASRWLRDEWYATLCQTLCQESSRCWDAFPLLLDPSRTLLLGEASRVLRRARPAKTLLSPGWLLHPKDRRALHRSGPPIPHREFISGEANCHPKLYYTKHHATPCVPPASQSLDLHDLRRPAAENVFVLKEA